MGVVVIDGEEENGTPPSLKNYRLRRKGRMDGKVERETEKVRGHECLSFS